MFNDHPLSKRGVSMTSVFEEGHAPPGKVKKRRNTATVSAVVWDYPI